MQSYDAIIIGAGHNGLVTAAYLAKAGKKFGPGTSTFDRRHRRHGRDFSGLQVLHLRSPGGNILPTKLSRSWSLKSMGWRSSLSILCSSLRY